MHFTIDNDVIISRTGYTGEVVLNLMPNDKIFPLWQDLLQKGKSLGIEPCGLGARGHIEIRNGICFIWS